MAAPAVRLPVLSMHWRLQAFVHWPYRSQDLQALLPPGLEPDLYDGRAWVSLTPFVMSAVRVCGLPMVPDTFPETNLRTYVRHPGGPSGLWFLSLEVTQPLLLAARLLGIPYRLAGLTVAPDGPDCRYTGSRRPSGPEYDLVVRNAGTAAAAPLDLWLTERFHAYSLCAGRLWRTPVRHEPWPLYRASVLSLAQSLTRASGLPDPCAEPLAHASPGVGPVALGPARPA
ncbi:YqjF family protein [Streptomyces sp. NPDC086989]|uniref:YqjF family protein n=1 Tax=Streptomyces sp. NPDC086989 TaxID=3365764 RepID=UPI0038142E8E